VSSPASQRLAFDLRRIMRSRYRIDIFQPTYFVIDDFEQLFAETHQDFAPIYRELESLPELAADARMPADRVIPGLRD
jgi:phenylalanine-4-hydroxylase